MNYEIAQYTTATGACPFSEWLTGLKDGRARAKITARVDRAARGNFGDWKSLEGAQGVYEMRDDYGPGYRIYYGIIGRRIVLLLAGSTKKDQERAIKRAKEYLAEYQRRVKK